MRDAGWHVFSVVEYLPAAAAGPVLLEKRQREAQPQSFPQNPPFSVEAPTMTATYLLLMSSVLGQYPYIRRDGYAPGYGYPYYGRTPSQAYDPMRYNRYWRSGEGYYTYTPPPIENPEVINFPRPASASQSPRSPEWCSRSTSPTGAFKVQLPTSVTTVAYGPATHFVATDGNFPVIKLGNLIKVDQNTIPSCAPYLAGSTRKLCRSDSRYA